jgi:dTDP-glucose pyrophosphorylase
MIGRRRGLAGVFANDQLYVHRSVFTLLLGRNILYQLDQTSHEALDRQS